MRLLIVHQEAEYFAGAEKVLGYYLEELVASGADLTVAAVRESRVREILPEKVATCWLPPNAKFSPVQWLRQAQVIRRWSQQAPFDLIHGWAARDWELTALAGVLSRRPALGTLHDHPQAPFISKSRQRLMAWSAAFGLRKIVCVSDAVRAACAHSGYQAEKLAVVHNGLPPASASASASAPRPARTEARFRLGYLGMFSERKGLRGLFQILDSLAPASADSWELALAGDAQEAEGRRLVTELKAQYSAKPWWPQVHWCGWVKRPLEFLGSLDLLICPSSDFDPFPTVLLEAGQAGVPVLGARVGGVAEIIEDGKTGWLFEAQAWPEAARRLKDILQKPLLARSAGEAARQRILQHFTVAQMVQGYRAVYDTVRPS